ncbi:P-loop containing nucleoside triphosphate hydrolase protein [Radiomyces spectabilis]|uniref:P-loop containing nucleoside triphosphate hydrolase protein n=1 Tax=Radiomyces spectabilis TaxID=64574 RepID=UPI002220CC33|nr:P-loop containing nucleoside triphosphate hydrolase protein [Radiomyces spectabilis]KAI8388540.1 P-loop containing nucleoside triphosphate hydrolase protein [Radiomyces spectabilis]
MNRLQNTELWQQLKNFQRIGVQKGIRRHARFLLADEMGLGKTIQALAIAYVYQETWPVLVIVPSSLRLTWKAEIQQWLDLQDEECPVIFKGSRKTMKFCIISYDLVSRNAEEITARKFKFIIADESHYIKNRAAKRTIALRPIFHQAKHVILLSGTPAFSRPVELYPQLEALRPDLFTSFHQYGLRYCAGTYQAFGWDYSGSTKLEELNFLLEKTIMVRRLKRDVDLELPKKTRQAIYMTLVPGKAKEVKCIKNEIDNLDNQIRLLYVESGKAKLPSMNEYIGHLLESTTSKIIVFAYHLEVMDGIENFITQQHAKVKRRIDGQTNQQVRRSLCEDFQSDVKVRVAILSIAAANVGLTLSAADVVVFGELFWNPSQLLQAEDRAHRIGRVGPVDIKYLLAMESIDGFQWPMVKRKLQIVGKALDGGQDKVNLDMSEKTEPEEKRHRPSHHQ